MALFARRPALAFAIVPLLLVCTGCGKTTLVGSGPYAPGVTTAPGLRYYLAKDVVIVTDTIRYELIRDVNPATLEVRPRLSLRTTRANVALKTAADMSRFYVINLEPKSTVEDELGITVGADGLLASVNYKATDKTAEALTGVVRGLSSILGIAGVLPPLHTPEVLAIMPEPSVWRDVFDKTWEARSLKGEERESAGNVFLATPASTVYFLKQSAGGIELWDTRARLDTNLRGLWIEHTKLLRRASAAASDKDMQLLTNRAKSVEQAITSTEARRKAAQASFEAALQRFLAENEIQKKTFSRTAVFVLELSDLPPSDVVAIDGYEDDVKLSLKTYSKVLGLFNETGIVVTVDPAQAHDSCPIATSDDEAARKDSKDDAARLFYRPPRSVVLTTYGLQSTPTKEGNVETKLLLREEQSVAVLHPGECPVRLEYSAKSFAESNFSLAFDARGRLTGVTQGSSAGGATAAEAFASSIQVARDEYAASLAKAKEIQETQQAIRLQALDAQIQEVQKKKDLIDARITAQGSTATAELVAEKERIDAELALLQSRAQLAESQVALEQSAEMAALRSEVERLKLEVEMLQRLAQLRALEEAKK